MKITTSLFISEQVKENVRKYLEEKLPNQELLAVGHNKEEYSYIYYVLTRDKETKFFVGSEYHVYFCWNESTQSLNTGTHNVDEQYATEIFMGGIRRKRELSNKKPSEESIEEICTKLKDKILEDDYEEGLVYLRDECGLKDDKDVTKWLGVNYEEMINIDEPDYDYEEEESFLDFEEEDEEETIFENDETHHFIDGKIIPPLYIDNEKMFVLDGQQRINLDNKEFINRK